LYLAITNGKYYTIFMTLRNCIHCDIEYDTKNKKFGLITQCNECGRREERKRNVVRHAGRRDGKGKHGATIIFRGDAAEYVRKTARRENAVGFNANLPVSNPIAVQKWEGIKEEKER
jgi:hypothetical protein